MLGSKSMFDGHWSGQDSRTPWIVLRCPPPLPLPDRLPSIFSLSLRVWRCLLPNESPQGLRRKRQNYVHTSLFQWLILLQWMSTKLWHLGLLCRIPPFFTWEHIRHFWLLARVLLTSGTQFAIARQILLENDEFPRACEHSLSWPI